MALLKQGTVSSHWHMLLRTQWLPQFTYQHNPTRTYSTTCQLAKQKSVAIFKSHHPPRLNRRVAIVTGASSGLGRAIALHFASHGAELVVCADLKEEPRPDGVEQDQTPTHEIIKSTYGHRTAMFVECDVTNATQVKAMVEAVVEERQRIDVLVNNAGLGNVSGSPLIHELDEKDWRRVINVNLDGTFLTNKYVLGQMIKQTPAKLSSATRASNPPPGLNTGPSDVHHLARRGTIINVSSMLGSIALPHGTSAYCASKGGVLNLTRQLALDYARYKINVNALCPGFLKTGMTAGNWGNEAREKEMKKLTPWGEWGRVEDVARMAVSLASEDAAWMTGEGVVVDGGYSAQ
ncbi:hypothetical protein PMZ80_010779 [Knufia obscura]|uniref:Uncharacterized protein n=1 Tax=Knufia obscura TaxID=1635080 RepID=A0ABR0R8R7_9EURO|nr:hypothetical protein PMZ80_010779 [Knufia obscura]